MTDVVRLLIRSCHPAPCVAVTVFATVLSMLAVNSAATTVLLAGAVLAGQLSIGWSNDRIDAERDRRTRRTDKPLAAAGASRRAIDVAIAISLVLTIALSLALGWWAGLIHLFAVACGWSYNLGLKATSVSWLPYALAFGALPAIAVLARAGHPAPAAWVVAAGALLGIAAHLTNAAPDLADDRATGVLGFPHRIGAPASLVLATVALAAASGLIVFGPRSAPSGLAWAGLGLVTLVAVGGLVLALSRPDSRWPFLGIVVLVAMDVGLLVVAASPTELL